MKKFILSILFILILCPFCNKNDTNEDIGDSIPPSITIISSAENPTDINPIPITITFTEDVTDFIIDDISVINGTTSNFQTIDAAVYTIDVTPNSNPADITINIAENAAQDLAGNNSSVAQFTIKYSVKIWEEYNDNPIISYGNFIEGIIWNDASVLKENDRYTMWLTGGRGFGINFVKVYRTTSDDGIIWDTPVSVFEPHSSTPILWVNITTNTFGGAYILVDEDTPVYQRAADYDGKEWYIFQKIPEGVYYLSATPIGAGVGIGVDSWVCTDDIPWEYPNAPLGNYNLDNGSGPDVVEVVIASSSDTFDNEKTETPSVIKVGATYHMYYSAFKIGDGPGRYQIGHATSSDGVIWTRDSEKNPVISFHNNPDMWGFYHTAEPGAVYNPVDEKIYLYYMTAKNRPGYSGNLGTQQGIALAISEDGTNFTKPDGSLINGEIEHEIVLTQSDYYSVEDNYVGYSTPNALIDSKGVFHLFYDVASYPGPNPDTSQWIQVAIAHATSNNGENFTEIETDIFIRSTGGWRDYQVLSPMVIEEDDYFKMWFAGGVEPIYPYPSGFYGIGFATFGANSK